MGVLRLALRLLRIALVVGIAIVAYAGRRVWAGELPPEDVERMRGRALARAFERLGATFVKLGQIMSTRPDLLGPGIIEALARLQDQVPPAPFETVTAVLDEDLPPSARARLASIDREPIAAASVAQVHRGELDDGQEVALKVQRPEARPQIERDLVLMELGARALEWIPTVRLLSLRGAVERFGRALHDQLDFRLEADNNRRFAASFADEPGVGVPALFPELCTGRVLCMELIHGVRATEPERVGGDRAQLARRGLEAILRMVFRDGFVHADLHPGNIFLTDDDRVVLIDLGLVAEIPDDMMRPFVETFMAIGNQDGPAAARLFYGYAPTVGDCRYPAFERDVVAFFRTIEGKRLGEVEASVAIGGMMNVLRRHHVQIDPVFTVVHIAMLVAEGLGKQLDASLDLVQLSLPYIVTAMAEAPPARPMGREPPGAGAGFDRR